MSKQLSLRTDLGHLQGRQESFHGLLLNNEQNNVVSFPLGQYIFFQGQLTIITLLYNSVIGVIHLVCSGKPKEKIV